MGVMFSILLAALAALAIACGSGDDDKDSSAAPQTPAVTAAAAPAAPTTAAAASTPTAVPLRGELAVFAAASLTDAFNEIGQEFQKANPGVTPKFNYAASSALRTQLEQGAKADLFASADQVQMDNARKAGVIEGEDRLFTKNKLVLIYPTSNPAKIAAIQDLAKPGVKFVLTDKAVPIGNYARMSLEKMSADPQFGADFGQKVLDNLRSEEANVRAVVTKVQLGEADAAIVYASDVTPSVSKDVQSVLIPDQFNSIATYPIAIVKDAPNRAAAQAFVEFVRSARGQEILKKNNFIVDKDTGAAWHLTPSVNGLFTSAQAPRRYSPSFTLGGLVDNPRTFELADLQALPSEEVAVEFISGTSVQQRTWRKGM
jgi:molybdate transport system substrate-binding protein